MQKEDLRIKKTNKSLYEALSKLMKVKSFDEIKISDICNEALINRSTFYAHYDDKYDLLMGLISELKNDLYMKFNNANSKINTKEYFMDLLKIVIDDVDEKSNIYSAIINNNKNSMLTDILFDVVTKDINKELKLSEDIKSDIPSDVITVFYLGAISHVVMKWITSNKKYSKEELIHYLDTLIPHEI